LDEESPKKISALLEDFLPFLRQSQNSRTNFQKDILDALWYWGKAALTNLPRDKLLESVIGLERLLIPYPGESRYRFALHGAAILAPLRDETENTAKELRAIYDQRSTIAHGQEDVGNKNQDPHEVANKAHKLLAKAIQKILQFYKSGKLTMSESVARQVEGLILRNAYLGPNA
jgi:hypothetical protein